MKALGPADPSAVASYRLIGVLGGGGMGRVYLGESRTGRRVAIKVVRDELAEDPIFRRRFAREVAAAKVVSPLYTAAVVDADPNADAPWLATTYIDGPNLTELVIDGGPLAPAAVLTLAAGLSEALASIHRVGLVHRDLKPSNVIINDAGPHIIDFGIALTVEATGRLTTSRVVGTPSYIAPEIIQGEDPTTASDVFSLGATLVFAATGKHLVADGTVYAQILQMTSGRFDLDGVPRELRPVVVRCISPEPRDRPTADELAHILIAAGVQAPGPDWYRGTGPAPVVLAGPEPRTRVEVSRRRLFAIGGLVGAAAVGSAIGVATGLIRRPDSVAGASWLPVRAAPAGQLPMKNPAPSTGPGAVIWDGVSGAPPATSGSGSQQPGVRVIVNPSKQLIASKGSDVTAVDPDGVNLWKETLSTSSVNLRPWGDAVLANDAKTLWLLDRTTGKVRLSRNVVADEEVSAKGANPDNLVIEIGAIALSSERAFIGLGTAVIAVDRQLTQTWRVARPYGFHAPTSSPRVANDTWVALQSADDTLMQISLLDARTRTRKWFVSYTTMPPSTVPGGPPPGGGQGGPGSGPPPGGGGSQGGSGGPPPGGGGDHDPGQTSGWDGWSATEGRLAPGYLALRDSSAIRVLRLDNGHTVWQKTIDNAVSGFEIVGDLLIVAADRISAYPLESDVAKWERDLRGARIAGTPDGQRIVAVNESDIVLLNVAGDLQSRVPLPSQVAGIQPDRVTAEDHIAYLTFALPPDRPPGSDVDTVAITLDP